MASPDYAKMVEELREVFREGRTKEYSWRLGQLKAILRLLTEEREALCEALSKDLRKDEFDCMVDEIGFCVNEAQWFIKNLARLMKNRKKSTDILNIGAKAYIHCEPFGVVLDIGAWNYPVQIPFSTMLSIIAAGNCVVLKPSELSLHTSNILAKLIPMYLDSDCVKVVEGAVAETTALLKERWDHVIYTGSLPVGKVVYKAAAEHMTPCTMELGGKCPSYVGAGSNLEAVCNRICWAKFKNCGQTCISVDYVLVDASIEKAFLDQMVASLKEQYSDNPATSDSYGRIINERHFQRVKGLLEASPNKRVVAGGEMDKSSLYIAPTIVTGVSVDERLMQEEIFGPVLPVISVKNHEEAIQFINAREKPLHLNVFSKSQRVVDEFVHKTSSGGFSTNDVMLFKIERGLPFGGVGASGFGCYGGESGFENFSHKKSVLEKSQGMEFLFKAMRYAPHTPKKLGYLSGMQTLPGKLLKAAKILAIIIPVAAVIGVAVYLGVNKDLLNL